MRTAHSHLVEHFVAADDETRLPLHVFVPPVQPRAAVLLFHGGGWTSGKPKMMFEHARMLADAGILTGCAGYRLVRSGAASPADCLADAGRADAAFRVVAAQAGVDRIAVGGGSAGAQLALGLAMGSGELEQREFAGLVLFNPAVDQCCAESRLGVLMRRWLRLTPEGARAASPVHHVRPGLPVSVVFHGTLDRIVPIETVRLFRDRMEIAGNDCELVEFPGEGHGFFRSNRRSAALDRTAQFSTLFLLTRAFGVRPQLGEPTGFDRRKETR